MDVTPEMAHDAFEKIDKRIAEIEAELPKVRRDITARQKHRTDLANERYGLVKMKKFLSGEADDDE